MAVKEYDLGKEMSYYWGLSRDDDREGRNVSLILDLGRYGKNSIATNAEVVHISDLRLCSREFHEKGVGCPYPGTDNDTEIVPNSWVKVGDVLTYKPPNGILPRGRAVSARIYFKAKPEVDDGTRIEVKGITVVEDRRLETGGQVYIIRVNRSAVPPITNEVQAIPNDVNTQAPATVYAPPCLPPDLFAQLRRAFITSSNLASDAALHTLFVDTRLAPWRDLIPDNTPNRIARVNGLIHTLHDKTNTTGENALVLFLHVLADHTDPADALHTTLLTLAADLELALKGATP